MSKKSISSAELYAQQFQWSEPKFYTRVPNIIDHLTYSIMKDGKKITKRLSVYAKELYRIIRMIASDDGVSWNSSEDLALKIGCAKSTISESTKELLMPMDQLDGSPLIIITEKTLKKTKENGHVFGVKFFMRTIVDIWKWNNAFMATVKHQKQYGKFEFQKERQIDIPIEDFQDSRSHGEQVDSSRSHGEQVLPGSRSHGERNNNPLKKNPLFKEQQPTADAASVCSLKKKKGRLSLSEEQRKSYDWMIESGCDEKSAFSISSNFTPKEIAFASEYLLKQQKKNKSKDKNIENIWGYFRQTLKGRYWENERF